MHWKNEIVYIKLYFVDNILFNKTAFLISKAWKNLLCERSIIIC